MKGLESVSCFSFGFAMAREEAIRQLEGGDHSRLDHWLGRRRLAVFVARCRVFLALGNVAGRRVCVMSRHAVATASASECVVAIAVKCFPHEAQAETVSQRRMRSQHLRLTRKMGGGI